MSCYNKKTNTVTLDNGAKSILFEKIKLVSKKPLEVYSRIKNIDYENKDVNGEPNFTFGGQNKVDDIYLVLASAGVEFKDIVEYSDEYEKRTGNKIHKNAQGLADAANNIILYSTKEGSLSEESVHLMRSSINSSTQVQRGLSMMNRDLDPQTWDMYYEVYQDEEMVKKEMLDKQIVQHLNQPQKGRLGRTIDAILKKIKSIFGKPGLKAQLDDIVQLMLDSEYQQADQDIMYFLKEEDIEGKDLDHHIKVVEDTVDKLTQVYNKSKTSRDKKQLAEITNEIQNGRSDLATLRMVNHIQTKVNNGKERLNELLKSGSAANEIAQVIRNLQDAFDAYEYFSNQFKPKDPLLKNELDLIDLGLTKYKRQFIETRRRVLAVIFMPYYQKNTGLELSKDDYDKLEEMFVEAEEVHYWDHMLSAMADSNDDYLKVIDQYVKDTLNKVELQTQNEIRKMFNLFDKLKDKSFTRFFQKVNNQLGSYLLGPVNTEQWSVNRENHFNSVRNTMGLSLEKATRDRQLDVYTEEGKKYAKQLMKQFKDGTLPFEVMQYKNKELVPMSYSEFVNKYKNYNEEILLRATKEYKKQLAVWFSDNSQPSKTLNEDIKAKFNRVLDVHFQADLRPFRKKVKEYFAQQTLDVTVKKDDKGNPTKFVEVNYAVFDIINSVEDIFGDSILEDQKDDIINALSEYKYWLDNNLRQDSKGNYYAAFDLSEPSSAYKSQAYYDLPKEDREFLDYLRKLKQKNLQMKRVFDLDLVPQVTVGAQEALESGSPTKLWNSIKDSFQNNIDDTEFGDVVNDQKQIPIYFQKKLNKDEMSRDLLTVFAQYALMANHHIEMSKVESVLNLSLDQAQHRDIVKKGYNWKGEYREIKKGQGGKNAEQLEAYIDKNLYGISQAEDDPVPKWLIKPISRLQNFVSLNSLGLNIFSGTANLLTSVATRYQERIANNILEDLTTNISKEERQELIEKGGIKLLKQELKKRGKKERKKIRKKADAFYFKYITGIIDSYGKANHNNKAYLVSSYLGISDELYQDMIANDVGKTRLLNIAKSAPYALNTMGEHYVAHKTGLHMGFALKLVKDGKETNLIEAMMDSVQPDGSIHLEGYKTLDGQDFTDLDMKKFGRKINKQNQALFGIYNNIDKAQAQRYVLGRLLFQFRKFVVPTINRRYQSKQFDYQTGIYREGMYRTSFNFIMAVRERMAQDGLSLLQATTKEREQLLIESPELYKNLIRTQVEMASILGALMLGIILTRWADDDDDNQILAFAAYQANRHFREMSFSAYPGSALEILNSPVAATNQLQSLAGFVKAFDVVGGIQGDDFLRKYKDGTGETYLQRAIERQIPFWRTIEKLQDPQAQFDMTK